LNVAGIYALGAAVDLLLEVGIERICQRVLAINTLFFDGLVDRNIHIATPMGKGERSGILSFAPSSDPKSLFNFLSRKRIMVSLRNGMIRLSPHFYNNGDDVRSLLRALDHFDS
jgi:selenocysteine lyase/cysteine desulfurase